MAGWRGGDGTINVTNHHRNAQSHNVVLIVDNVGNCLSNKPPEGKIRTDCTRRYGRCTSLPGLGNGEVEEGLACSRMVRVDDPDNPVCTIRNHDTGKEFVENEVREDGTWNKLKEVGKGR